ncbi:MAG: DUF1801 domain-containing protein [Flavobacteriales bacterium]|nr:DUF1801 domain-containing protein [Flavobacteriales bacterium]
MRIDAKDCDDYVSKVPEKHKEAIVKLRETIKKNLPKGFEETLNYSMPGYVVPHSLYPDGYHCDPKLPLPFMSIASQKNFIGLYHMGIYANKELYDWWVKEYQERVPTKLDMGKSCVRLKKPEHIPYDLVAELCQKMTPQDWIDLYEKNIKR